MPFLQEMSQLVICVCATPCAIVQVRLRSLPEAPWRDAIVQEVAQPRFQISPFLDHSLAVLVSLLLMALPVWLTCPNYWQS